MGSTWSVGKKLLGGIGVLFALILASSGMTYWVASSMSADLDNTTNVTVRKLDLSRQVRTQAVTLEGAQRRTLLAGFGNDQQMFTESAALIVEELKGLRTDLDSVNALLVSDEGRKAVADLKSALSDWESSNKEVERLVREGKTNEAWTIARERSNPQIDAVLAHADTIVKQQQDFMKASQADSDAAYTRTVWMMAILLIVSVAVSGLIGYVVRGVLATLRDTTTELAEGAEQVSGAATQVSTAAQSLSQGATEQAASLEETSASMEEMASMTRKNAESTEQAAGLMGNVDTGVADSNRSLTAMVASMSSIKDSSAKVSKIIKTIDEIAFQTNILALNAAVEAARAGEAGMGFAVVADEVRNLAQRSAQAAKDTASLIEESISNSNEGTVKVQQVVASIAGITESVGRVKGLIEEVSVASRQQSQGIEQVSQAIAQMEKVTQTTAATAEESAAASEELNAQAEATMSAVGRLTELVNGSSGAGSAAVQHRRTSATVLRMSRSRSHAGVTDAIDLSPTGTDGL